MSGVVLVVGSGGREHALTLALASCPSVTRVLVTPGNAGTLAAPKASHITLPLKDHQVSFIGLVSWCEGKLWDYWIKKK